MLSKAILVGFLLFTLLRAHPVLAQSDAYPDVNGLRLGMSLEQIRQKLGPTYEFTTAPPKSVLQDPNEVLVSAGSRKTAPSRDAWLFVFVDQRSIYISHVHEFSPDNYPDVNVTNHQVIEKYGAVDSTGKVEVTPDAGQKFVYVYRPNGTVITGKNDLLAYVQGSQGGLNVPWDARVPDALAGGKVTMLVDDPTQTPGFVCPVALEVVVTHTSGGRTLQVQATLVDGPGMTAEAKRLEQANASDDEKAREQRAAKTKATPSPF